MSKLAFLSSGAGVTAGAGAAVVGAVALIAYGSGAFEPRSKPALEPQIVEPAPVAQVSVKQAVPEAKVEAVAPKVPSFDVVRVETDGAAMIAGSADAGATVAIRLNETVVAEVKADASGKFASFVSLPASETARVLTLDVEGGEVSEEQVIITPIVPAEPVFETVAKDEVARAEPAQEVVAPVVENVEVVVVEPLVEAAAPVVELVEAPEVVVPDPVVIAEPAPQAPTVLLATKEGVRVLQAPDAAQPDAMTALLGAISYDDAGDVALTGRAGGEFVRVYLDNRPVATSQIAANGDWQADLPAVDTGIYTLRVDELNEEGAVVARVETPFKREAADVLAAATAPEAPLQAITVQPGATLWAIARERYGSGTLYARVVEANADTIKDPDLIYPGQVFAVPD